MSKSQDGPSLLPDDYTHHSTSRICSLWAGYGSISRLNVSPSANKSLKQTLVLKTINPPSTSKTRFDESHQRKLLSYNVERYFYAHLAPQLSSLSAKVATCIAHDEHSLLLEDLNVDYPVQPYHGLDKIQTTAVLKWLASYHATFWNPMQNDKLSSQLQLVPPPSSTSADDTSLSGIWEQGGYWYLDTRRAEYASIQNDEEYEWLVKYAEIVTDAIKNTRMAWKTVVHGDAKAANIVFDKATSKKKKKSKSAKAELIHNAEVEEEEVGCALYDFQYPGIGLPTQDLVYFIGTSVEYNLLPVLENGEWEDGILRSYYDALCSEMGNDKLAGEYGYTYDVFVKQWELALVDWCRFMAGWGMWGSSDWVEECAKSIVEKWDKEGFHYDP